MWLIRLRPILGNGLHSNQIVFKKHEIFNMSTVLPMFKYNHRRTYKNFGHKKDPPEHPLKKIYLITFMGLVIYQFIDWN